MYKSAHMHTHTPNTCVCVHARMLTDTWVWTDITDAHTDSSLPWTSVVISSSCVMEKKSLIFPMANFNSTWEVELVPPEPAPPGWLRSSWQKQDTPKETVALSHKSGLGLQGEGLWHLPVLDYMGPTPQCCSHQCGFLYYFMEWQRRQ